MKDRLVTLALAIAAFALFYVLMLHQPESPQDKVTRPQSTEKGPNGYLALSRWLEANGLAPVSFRERFTQLDALEGVPESGNLMISTAPHLYPVRDSETASLREWIAAGNTLLMVAGLSDTPEWSMGQGMDVGFMNHLRDMTGLSFTQIDATAEDDAEEPEPESDPIDAEMVEVADEQAQSEPEAESAPESDTATFENPFQKLDEPLAFEMVPNGVHPLLEGVQSVGALSEYATAKWRATSSTLSDLVLELASDPATGEPVLWLVRHGDGQIVVSAYGSVFVNKLLGEKDNARLLANLVHWSLGPDGRVLIDDAHQGLVAFYDPEKFFGDERLHATLWWLLGLWLVFVLGSQRLRANGSRWEPIDVTSFVRASGGFMARVVKPAVAAQQLFTHFFNEVRQHIGMPTNGAPVWDWLESRSAVEQRDLDQLREWHGRALRGRRLDLPALQNLLTRVRHQLT